MTCPACAHIELVLDTRDIPYTYKGKSTTIPGVNGNFCPACGEVVLHAPEAARSSARMLEFHQEVNAAAALRDR